MAILMRTHNIPRIKENRKIVPIMPPDLALCLTPIRSNFRCLEHLLMVPKVFEPLKFYCNMLKEYVDRDSSTVASVNVFSSVLQKQSEMNCEEVDCAEMNFYKTDPTC